MTGVLLVDKPEGMSSAGVIRVLASRLRRSKVGHVGTLDPFASGLLPLCIGEATKIARYLLVDDKSYEGIIRLGWSTDTLDRTGTEVDRRPVPALTPEDVAAAARRFTGPQQQVPPMYSALKRDGVPLYKLARRGIEVERPSREIVIRRLEVELLAPDRLRFTVDCSKGTYVRVLAADIAKALGTVGHLETLRRTVVGRFRVEDAAPVDALRDEGTPLRLLTIREALQGLREMSVSPGAIGQLERGQQGALDGLGPSVAEGEVAAVLDDAGQVRAMVAAAVGGGWRLVRVLHPM